MSVRIAFSAFYLCLALISCNPIWFKALLTQMNVEKKAYKHVRIKCT